MIGAPVAISHSRQDNKVSGCRSGGSSVHPATEFLEGICHDAWVRDRWRHRIRTAQAQTQNSTHGLRQGGRLPMPHHKLKLDVRDGRIVAGCECGQWERLPNIQAERPSEVMRQLEEEHARHVAEATGPGSPPNAGP
jgi:hypothetical protein